MRSVTSLNIARTSSTKIHLIMTTMLSKESHEVYYVVTCMTAFESSFFDNSDVRTVELNILLPFTQNDSLNTF